MLNVKEIQKLFIDDFVDIKFLKEGGMSFIYKAKTKDIGRNVAIKVLKPSYSNDKYVKDKFQEEARVASMLEHQNIIYVIERGSKQYSEDISIYYIVMEFINGFDLHTLVREKGPLDLARIQKYTIPILDALQFMHSHANKFVHRDVKSGNILVRKGDERPVLIDFGVVRARAGDFKTMPGMNCGTPEYMSPEQAQGGEVDPRTDLYSMGVVLYELFTGRVPFVGENELETLHKIKNSPPTRPSRIIPDFDKKIEAFLVKALSKDPDKRFQSAAEMKAALLMATGEASLPRINRFLPNIRINLMKVAVIGLMACIGLILVLWMASFSEKPPGVDQPSREEQKPPPPARNMLIGMWQGDVGWIATDAVCVDRDNRHWLRPDVDVYPRPTESALVRIERNSQGYQVDIRGLGDQWQPTDIPPGWFEANEVRKGSLLAADLTPGDRGWVNTEAIYPDTTLALRLKYTALVSRYSSEKNCVLVVRTTGGCTADISACINPKWRPTRNVNSDDIQIEDLLTDGES